MQGCRFQPLLPFGVKRSFTLLYLLFSKFGNLLPSFPSLSQAPKWANIEPGKRGKEGRGKKREEGLRATKTKGIPEGFFVLFGDF